MCVIWQDSFIGAEPQCYLIIKLDIYKAFDSVCWDYMLSLSLSLSTHGLANNMEGLVCNDHFNGIVASLA